MIYFTSDLHFCHDRSFIYKPRGFKNVEDMNNQIIKNWNNIIKWDDEVFILGDLMLNDNKLGLSLLSSLYGQKIIILGNHDTNTRIELYKTIPKTQVLGYAGRIDYQGYHFYLSHYPTLTGNNDEDKPLKKQVINLCGHTHTKDKFIDMDKGLIYHCELDAHNNTPISIDQIIKDIKNKKKECESDFDFLI